MLQEHYLRRIVILYDIAENVAWQPQWPAWLILLHHERPPVQHALRENQQLVRDVLVKGPERKLCLRRSVNAGGRGGGRSVGGAGRLSRGYRSPRAAASIAQRVSQRLNVIAQHTQRKPVATDADGSPLASGRETAGVRSAKEIAAQIARQLSAGKTPSLRRP
jgi:hypothetical protein